MTTTMTMMTVAPTPALDDVMDWVRTLNVSLRRRAPLAQSMGQIYALATFLQPFADEDSMLAHDPTNWLARTLLELGCHGQLPVADPRSMTLWQYGEHLYQCLR